VALAIGLGMLGLMVLAVPTGLVPLVPVASPSLALEMPREDRAACPDSLAAGPRSAAVPSAKASGRPTEAIPGALQRLIDEAAPGSTVIVPAAIYREAGTIDKPLALIAAPGAEIRGSDVWTDWHQRDDGWVSGPAPEFREAGFCRADGESCKWRNQVFIDGTALRQVEERPGAGEFAVSHKSEIVLGEDPTGRSVEVTTRPIWISVEANDVTIAGFTMRHAAAAPQFGGVNARDVSGTTVRENHLTESHGAAISIHGGAGHSVVANDLHANGQLGLQINDIGGMLVERNVIRSNNTEDFDPHWEAGGMKATRALKLRVVDNEVCANGGPGLWCDINCGGTTITGNRVHGNDNAAIHFEISSGSAIEDNEIWSNGWAFPIWGWGAGILISSAADARVIGNVLAWNADGISVISQDRGATPTAGNRVEGNTILTGPSDGDTFALAWLDDWSSGMFDESRGNGGSLNAYWFPGDENGRSRYAWNDRYPDLGRFNATPGEEGGRYLSSAERDAVIEEARLPGVR
jgi:parallel beta-helix repeat protein